MRFCGLYAKITPVECGTLRKQLKTRAYSMCNTVFSIYRQNQRVNNVNSVDFFGESLFFEYFIVNTYAALKGEDCNDASRAKTCVTL